MDESTNNILETTKNDMEAAVEFLVAQMKKIRTGKASPTMLEGVSVDYYGSMTPLSQVGNVSVADARMLTVTPWEKNMIPVIEKAIRESGLGLNPSSDGDLVRIPIPPLNEERRKSLVKQAKEEGEQAKTSVRTVRQTANNEIKKAQKEGLSEDDAKKAMEKVQEITNNYNKKIDDMIKEKESQIMTV